MQTFYLASSLHEKGIAQSVVCPQGSPLALKCQEKGIPVFPLPLKGEWDLYSAYALGRLAEELTGKGYDVIFHAHTAKAHGIALAAKKIFFKFPLVVSRRVDFPAGRSFLSRWKYQSPLTDRFIAISENVKNVLLKDGISPERIRIAKSGVDTLPVNDTLGAESLRKEFGLKSSTVVFGNVGALVPHKDQKTFLKAGAIFLKKYNISPDSVRFFITGEGELEAALKKEAQDLGISSCTVFTGFRRDVRAFHCMFDVFMMTSSEEGLGTSVLDAMTEGKPVIGTRGGGIPEMVDDGKGGYLCSVGDSECIADRMNSLYSSAELRKVMGLYNQVRVREFSYKNTAAATLKIYEEVLSAQKDSRTA